jgi:predicted nucleotidyltransferase
MNDGIAKQDAIEEITRRLIEYYKPARIHLFGSEARGDDCARRQAAL